MPWWFVLVGVLGGGYLHALELVPWWFVLVGVLGRFVVGGYLHTLELVPWWLVSLVGSWLVVTCLGACALVVRVLGRFVVGGYLHALELVPFERLYKFYLYKQLKI